MSYNMTDNIHNIKCTLESYAPGVYHIYLYFQPDNLTNRFEVQLDEDLYELYYHNEYEVNNIRKNHTLIQVQKEEFEKKLLNLIHENNIQVPIVATNKLNDPLPEAFWIWYVGQTFFEI